MAGYMLCVALSNGLPKTLLTVLLLLHTVTTNGEPSRLRELGTIRYHLTTCGSYGRLGPTSDSQCINYYQTKNSPVARDDLILQQTQPPFRGGQLVTLPRTTTYNLTVAGASGGKGLCSPLYGRGVVIRAQANFAKGLQMLVLVGQRGHGPCEFAEPRNDSVCSVNNATLCNETWWNDLLSSAGSYRGNEVYQNTGGGGGGGASMIRLKNEGDLQVFPFIVAAGGGGGAAVLDLDFIKTVNFTHMKNATQMEIYQEFVDGKGEFFDRVLSDRQNQRGFINPLLIGDHTAGAGGGYVSGLEEIRRVDGSQLAFEDAFAEGGVNCDTASLFPTSFTDEVGGFGAGGGGCGGGGGGGGQTGGAIVGAGNLSPGGGGYSITQERVKILGYSWNSEGDGYVDIVAADCGCVYECIVYEAKDQFECECPNDTQLAPDLSDCYFAETRQVTYRDWDVDISGGYEFKLVDFSNSTSLYSISAMLTNDILYDASSSRETEMSDILCALAFIGTNEEMVLISTPNENEPDILRALSEVQVNFSDGSFKVSEPTDLLSYVVPVTGAVLISQGGDCYIHNGSLSMNISIQNITESGTDVFGYPNLRNKILENPETISSLLMQILQQHRPTVKTNTTNFKFTEEYVIITVLTAGAMLAVVLTALVCLTCICCCKRKQKKEHRERHLASTTHLQASTTSSMTSNAVYRDVIFPHSKYYFNSHQMEVNERYNTYGSLKSGPESNFTYQQVQADEYGRGGVVIPPGHSFCNFNRQRLKSGVRDSEWQYPRNQLIYMREIGEGQFGKVLLMKAQRGIAGYHGDLPMAVKTLTSRDPDMIAKFMEEAELMKKFSHPNIVSLLGISTDDVLDDDNAPLMILEYMPYGDLHAFLMDNRPGSHALSVHLVDAHFIHFASDVAKALEFLTQLKYVHRDIAARNCLVGSGLQIKMADFGLTRKLNSQNYFAIEGAGILPIRAMAPECFLSGRFTTASDVWSYGVLLWEMISYGAIPLPGLSSRDITERVHSRQLQHVIPPECPPVLSSLISQCHSHDPNQRPSFTNILTQLPSTK